nr:hypothetical protein [Nocardia aurea]
MEQLDFFLRPGQLTGEFRLHETLQQWSEESGGTQQVAGIGAHLVGGHTGIDECQFRGAGGTVADVPGPCRYPFHQKDLLQQRHIALRRRCSQPEIVAQCGVVQQTARPGGEHLDQRTHLGGPLDVGELDYVSRDQVADVGTEEGPAAAVVGARYRLRKTASNDAFGIVGSDDAGIVAELFADLEDPCR